MVTYEVQSVPSGDLIFKEYLASRRYMQSLQGYNYKGLGILIIEHYDENVLEIECSVY